ncbi:hypothetical protein SDC9_52688 [bioreactor metagenome]|uniref:4Fe-4S ferredoxin-type domain-containing protein n=1 Tax=bioreactor metagenome TaxID=1076179 RepID=A0A644WRR5_9ZZZZ
MGKQISITVNEKLCKQCGICEYMCPKQVLKQEMGYSPKIVNLKACIGCRLCQMSCPDFAIEVEVIG